ncbi:hypothetical protein KW790_02555 [Candidatus Parcubacteria bacterium]|nr:hypothetical protein [Candidatus Parcubacteria bacterium]
MRSIIFNAIAVTIMVAIGLGVMVSATIGVRQLREQRADAELRSGIEPDAQFRFIGFFLLGLVIVAAAISLPFLVRRM